MKLYVMIDVLLVLTLCGSSAGQAQATTTLPVTTTATGPATDDPPLTFQIGNLQELIRKEISRQIRNNNQELIPQEVRKQVKEANNGIIKEQVTRQIRESNTELIQEEVTRQLGDQNKKIEEVTRQIGDQNKKIEEEVTKQIAARANSEGVKQLSRLADGVQNLLKQQSTTDMVEITRLSTKVSSLEGKLVELYKGLESAKKYEKCQEQFKTDMVEMTRLNTKISSLEGQYIELYIRLESDEKCEQCVEQLNTALGNINDTLQKDMEEIRREQTKTNRETTERLVILEKTSESIQPILSRVSTLENITSNMKYNMNVYQNTTETRLDEINEDNKEAETEREEIKESLSQTMKTVQEHHPKFIAFKKSDGSLPEDCSEVYSEGQRGKAVYQIQPQGSTPFLVYCDLNDGGWTLFMRRYDGSQDFYKKWTEYKEGFGSVIGEHWLGNDHLYFLTKQKNYTMRMDYTIWDSREYYYVQYSTFRIESESNNYRLTVSGYSGTNRDTWIYHNGQQFSTRDRDNDVWRSSCAQSWKGGHWYKDCHRVNPTGLYKASGYDNIRVNTNKGSLSASKMTLKIKAV